MPQFHITFPDLYTPEGLHKVDAAFMTFLKEQNASIYGQLCDARQYSGNLENKSALLITLAPYVEKFISTLFNIGQDVEHLQAATRILTKTAAFKRHFIQKRIIHKYKDYNWLPYTAASFESFIQLSNTELIRQMLAAQSSEDTLKTAEIEIYIAWRCLTEEGQSLPYNALFDLPEKTDYQHLFPYEENDHRITTKSGHRVHRDGFDLTDQGSDAFHAAAHAHYCLKCHKTDKDSCAHGLKDKNHEFQLNPLGNILHGCPLDQKISEMNVAYEDSYSIGALAIITLDNPMVAATGYRICNDCEKACIFQKQTPVDVPSIETQILKDVLSLPWGFEIYSLLTRWNPLNFSQPLPKPLSGYTVLVAGMGPAGFTLAHYLLRQGHQVVGIDGLKIESLPVELTQTTDKNFKPIKDIAEITEPLSERPAYGFGGVAEYGITVRWNKNYLKIIRLILERQTAFRLMGNTRFGGTLTLKTAYELGFDHVALCLGAGKPSFPSLPNGFAKGIRAASDFLMALQLTGAAKQTSLTNLQIRLPLVVIGGGLTAVDTATEALAYYPLQVEKFWQLYQTLCSLYDQEAVEKYWTDEDRLVAQEFLTHAQAIEQERQQAKLEERPPNIAELLTSWGGVTILYRKSLQEAPAYRLNADEIQQALAQGVQFLESAVPIAVKTDNYGHISSFEILKDGQAESLDVKTLFYATGTQANTFYAQEHPQELFMDNQAFRSQDQQQPFIVNSIKANYVSAFGDLDPAYAGSVVKAMASAKKGYLLIDQSLKENAPLAKTPDQFLAHISKLLQPRLVARSQLHDNLTLLTIEAPLAAQAYQPGHFFRLQSFEQEGRITKAVAITPIQVDREQGHLTFVVSQAGPSSRLLNDIPINSSLALMGPTGCPSIVPCQQRMLVVAQGFYALLQLPLMKAALEKDSTVYLYVPQPQNDELLAPFIKDLKDLHILRQENELAAVLPDMDHILVMGNEPQMRDFRDELQSKYQHVLKTGCDVVASINSPMQCMMKEICAQCIQLHKDHKTGKEEIMYSCAYQDQPLATLDLDMLKNRLNQNSLLEKVTRSWVENQC